MSASPLRFGSVRPVTTTEPFDGRTLFAFLRSFAVPGVEEHTTSDTGVQLVRTLRLTHGAAAVRLGWDGRHLTSAYAGHPTDEAEADARVRALVDADAPVEAISATLAADPHLAGDVASSPGLRLPGATDLGEAAVQALVSQQISMAAAARCSAKIAVAYGDPVEVDGTDLGRLFPTMDVLADVDPTTLPMPRARGRALVSLAGALASGSLVLDRSRPWSTMRDELLALPGIGPWTADVIGLRGLLEPDMLLTTDLAVRRQLDARAVTDPSGWAPFRSYATVHLWRSYV